MELKLPHFVSPLSPLKVPGGAGFLFDAGRCLLGPGCWIRPLQLVKRSVWCHDMKDDPQCVRGTNDQTISDMAMNKTTVKLCSGASKDNNNNNNGDCFRQDRCCLYSRDFQRHCSLFSLCSETSSVLAYRHSAVLMVSSMQGWRCQWGHGQELRGFSHLQGIHTYISLAEHR